MQMWKGGEVPLWNPYSYLGFPLLAATEMSTLYPLNILFFLPLSFPLAASYFIIVHYSIASILMYALAGELGMGRWGRMVSSIAFAYSGFMIAQGTHLNIVTAAAWLPGLFYMGLRFMNTRRWIYVALPSLIFAIQILTGHPQIVAYSIVGLLAFCCLKITLDQRRGEWRTSLKPILGVSLGVILGGALAAVQLLPSYELKQLSSRASGLPFSSLTSYSMTPWQLPSLLFPNLFGSPNSGDYIGAPNFYELYQYVGIPTLLLAVLCWTSREHRRLVVIFAVLGVVFLLLSLGRYFPPYGAFQWVPIFNAFRVPARWFLLVALSLAVLAGFGANAIFSSDRVRSQLVDGISGPKALVGAVALGALGFILLKLPYLYDIAERFVSEERFVALGRLLGRRYLALNAWVDFILFVLLAVSVLWMVRWWKWRLPVPAITLVVFLIADLFYHGGSVNAVRDPSYFLFPGDWSPLLLNDKEIFRIFPTQGGGRRNEPSVHLSYDFPLFFGIHSVKGRSDLTQVRHDHLLAELESGETRQSAYKIDAKLLGLVNAKYVTSADPIVHPDLEEKYTGGMRLLDFQGDEASYRLYIYRNKRFMPRAFGVFDAEYAGSPDEALAKLVDPSFDPRYKVILEDKPPLLNKSLPPIDADVQIKSLSPSKIEVSARFSEPGFLVLSNSYYPGWKVYVDGRQEKLWLVDYLLQGVVLPSGDHHVTFLYDPLSFKIGATISAFSLLIVFIALGLSLRRFGLFRDQTM